MRTRTLALAVASLALTACAGELPTESALSASGSSPILDPAFPTKVCHARTTARALDVRTLILNSVVSQAGPIGCTGADDQYVANSSLPGVYAADALRAQAQGANHRSEASASLANLDLTIHGARVTAELVESFAHASCGLPIPVKGGGSLIASLRINGIAYDTRTTTVIDVGGVRIHLNEQIQSFGSITVNALRITAAGLADVVVSSSTAEISCW